MVQLQATSGSSMAYAADHLPPAKFENEALKMIVRNTFIDFENAHTRAIIERSSSAPASAPVKKSASMNSRVVTLASLRSGSSSPSSSSDHSARLDNAAFDRTPREDSALPGGDELSSCCDRVRLLATTPTISMEATRTTTHGQFVVGGYSNVRPVEAGHARIRTYDHFEHGHLPMGWVTCTPEWMLERSVTPVGAECSSQHAHIEDSSKSSKGDTKSEDPELSGVIQRQAQTLTHNVIPDTGITYIHWCVDSRKLKSNDRVAVSPPFEICGVAPFKLMLYALTSSCTKGGTSFRKSKGWGITQLKCEAQPDNFPADNFSFYFLIGRSEAACKRQLPHGAKQLPKPDFTRCGVAGLARESAEWDFNEAVDEQSQTFTVCLGIIPDRG